MNQVILADAIDYLPTIPNKSVDVVFLDPPYNINKKTGTIQRPEGGIYRGVTEDWDNISNDRSKHLEFILWYVSQAQRVTKDTGTVWIMGTYHNIHDVGSTMLNLGYFILNDIIWVKANPAPQMRGVRFCNSIETILYAQPNGKQKHYFDYKLMKSYNNGIQMRADWKIPLCRGKERITIPDPNYASGYKVLHQTQKPLELLKRVVLSSVPPDGTILDFMAGVGTTGVAAALYNRHYILIEKELSYVEAAVSRLSEVNSDFDVITP